MSSVAAVLRRLAGQMPALLSAVLPMPCPLCGRTMRRGLIQSGGVLYFTDEEKYWINWPLKSRGDIPLLGGKLFPTFPDDGATKLAQICTDCEVVLFYYGKKWDDRRWNR